ncbi:hypothetical protein, partial [uncultured Sphaerotilus sp.]|uniref:hypothetical protein n=1 Tax=uncultured Sphaerotilus sp. TaxID=474984 RepID=UPI0030CA5A9C
LAVLDQQCLTKREEMVLTVLLETTILLGVVVEQRTLKLMVFPVVPVVVAACAALGAEGLTRPAGPVLERVCP